MKCDCCKFNNEDYQEINGFIICKDCIEIYEFVYKVINGTTNLCLVKRKDL